LDKIKAAKARGARDLLVYLKENHPPKFASTLAEPEYDDIRRALRKHLLSITQTSRLSLTKRGRLWLLKSAKRSMRCMLIIAAEHYVTESHANFQRNA